MKLSSLDIRKQEFTRVVRGYDKEEVDAFLQLVANQWQEVVDDLRREGEKTQELNNKLEHYQKVEEALEEALKTARDSAKHSIENAEQKARLLVEEAEAQSIGITKDAEAERLDIRKDAAKYSVRQKEIVAKLRAFLMSELEILAQYESESPANYVKLMPAKPAELVEDLSSRKEKVDSVQNLIPKEEPDLDEVEREPVATGADQSEADEAVAVDQEVDTSDSEEASGARKKKAAKKGISKDPEVSDEIEKIRRILEDLEK